MFNLNPPKSRHLLSVAAMALTIAAFSAPASAAGLGVTGGTQLGASVGGVGLNSGAGVSVDSTTSTSVSSENSSNAATTRYKQNGETYQNVIDPAVDMQIQNDTNAAYELRDAQNVNTSSDAEQTSSYEGTTLYNETGIETDATAATPQRTARAATSTSVDAGPNHMRAMNGGIVTFNE